MGTTSRVIVASRCKVNLHQMATPVSEIMADSLYIETLPVPFASSDCMEQKHFLKSCSVSSLLWSLGPDFPETEIPYMLITLFPKAVL
jgi:hypothetical protein